jgi:putative colanic acid biosynthesis acetyltransferase WcaF
LSKYINKLSFLNKLYRFTWQVTFILLFRPFSPKLFNKWRILVLKIFGSKIYWSSGVYSTSIIWAPYNLELGKNSWLGPHTKIYNVDKIIIKDNVVISQYSYLCTASHNFEDINFPLIHKHIIINNNVWIGADAFIGMGVILGQGCIIGARSSVFKNVDENIVVGGNPAKFIKNRKFES